MKSTKKAVRQQGFCMNASCARWQVWAVLSKTHHFFQSNNYIKCYSCSTAVKKLGREYSKVDNLGLNSDQ